MEKKQPRMIEKKQPRMIEKKVEKKELDKNLNSFFFVFVFLLGFKPCGVVGWRERAKSSLRKRS